MGKKEEQSLPIISNLSLKLNCPSLFLAHRAFYCESAPSQYPGSLSQLENRLLDGGALVLLLSDPALWSYAHLKYDIYLWS